MIKNPSYEKALENVRWGRYILRRYNRQIAIGQEGTYDGRYFVVVKLDAYVNVHFLDKDGGHGNIHPTDGKMELSRVRYGAALCHWILTAVEGPLSEFRIRCEISGADGILIHYRFSIQQSESMPPLEYTFAQSIGSIETHCKMRSPEPEQFLAFQIRTLVDRVIREFVNTAVARWSN